MTTTEGEICTTEYTFIDYPLDFTSAQEACETFGYTLAAYANDGQLINIQNHLPTKEYWIGLAVPDGVDVLEGNTNNFEYIFLNDPTKAFGTLNGGFPWITGFPIDNENLRCVR